MTWAIKLRHSLEPWLSIGCFPVDQENHGATPAFSSTCGEGPMGALLPRTALQASGLNRGWASAPPADGRRGEAAEG